MKISSFFCSVLFFLLFLFLLLHFGSCNQCAAVLRRCDRTTFSPSEICCRHHGIGNWVLPRGLQCKSSRSILPLGELCRSSRYVSALDSVSLGFWWGFHSAVASRSRSSILSEGKISQQTDCLQFSTDFVHICACLHFQDQPKLGDVKLRRLPGWLADRSLDPTSMWRALQRRKMFLLITGPLGH